MPPLYRLAVRTTPAAATAIEAALADEALATTSVHEPRTHIAMLEALFDYLPAKADFAARLSVIAATCGAKAPPIVIERVPQTDWLAKVAREHPPLPAGRLTIHCGADRARVPPHRPALLIEAATAFGTGEHPTTFGCLLALQNVLKRGKPRRTLDIGCGSGILALAVARLARRPVLAVDCERESVRMARHNARANHLQGYVRVAHGDGYRAPGVRAGGPYDLILANIFARPLALMAKDLRANLVPGGTAILSGLLTAQENMVLAAHRAQGLACAARWRSAGIGGDWAVLVLRRASRA
ncbi:MAG: methyltransferase [Alphaproteobacteria bacterium]|nr:methyltransferase [Alphaproteobacteria bacterium]